MLTKDLHAGDSVLTIVSVYPDETIVSRAVARGVNTVAKTVDRVQRNAGPKNAYGYNRVYFTDNTSALAAAGQDWIMV